MPRSEETSKPVEGVLLWEGAVPCHDPGGGELKRVRVVGVGREIRHEQLDGWDSMGAERWNPLHSSYYWKLVDALVVQVGRD